MNMTFKIVCLFLLTYTTQMYAQHNVTIETTPHTPERMDGESDIMIGVEFMINNLEYAKDVVMAIGADENAPLRILNTQPITQVGYDYFLNGDQLIHNRIVRCYTNFYKDQLSPGDKLIIYVSDREGQTSNKLSFSLSN